MKFNKFSLIIFILIFLSSFVSAYDYDFYNESVSVSFSTTDVNNYNYYHNLLNPVGSKEMNASFTFITSTCTPATSYDTKGDGFAIAGTPSGNGIPKIAILHTMPNSGTDISLNFAVDGIYDTEDIITCGVGDVFVVNIWFDTDRYKATIIRNNNITYSYEVVNSNNYTLTQFSSYNARGVQYYNFINNDVDYYSRSGGAVNNIYYIDNITTSYSFNINNFIITAKNKWNNSALTNFSALVNGTLYNDSGTGTITTPIQINNTNLFNVTIIKDNYFNQTFLNVNASINNSVDGLVYQSIITPECNEKISGYSLNCSNSTIYPNAETLNLTIASDGYYDLTQEKTINILDNKTISFNGFYSNILNITAKYINNDLSINNFSITLDGINYSYSEINNTSNGYLLFNLINGYYNLSITSPGYAPSNYIINIENITQSYEFELYTENSISFNIYNRSSLTLLNTTTVNIALHGSTVDYSVSTTNGTYYIDDLNDDTYKITFTSALTSANVLYGTISEGNHLDINVYLGSDLTEISFLAKNTLGTYLGDVILSFIQTINGSDITVSQAVTDFSGRAIVNLDPAIDYSMFATKTGYETFTGTVIPTELEYTITLTEEGSQRFISLFEDVKLLYYLDYIVGDNYAYPYLILNSESGALNWYGMNVTYNSVNYFINQTGIPAGGIEFFNISLVPSIRYMTVDYFFKVDGHPAAYWNSTYFLINVTPSNNTITSGLFDDVEALESTDPGKVIIAMFLILILFLIFYEASLGNGTAGVIGAMLGLGLSYKFSFLPGKLTIVSLIVCGVLIVADQVGGRL